MDEYSQKRSAFYHGYVVNNDDSDIGIIDSVFHYLFTSLIESVCNKIGKKHYYSNIFFHCINFFLLFNYSSVINF